MIDVQDVLSAMPHFETFCSVQKLHAQAERLRTDPRFAVTVAGKSAQGRGIHHVRFGAGRVRVLVVGFPHCCEPIGGLTVFSLLTLLEQGHRGLCAADVEWHVVPCIDPDGAILNEGWTQQPFTLENRMRHFHLQPLPDQVDGSFPIQYKRLAYERPSAEALVLKRVIDGARPDFYFTLHDARVITGVWYFLTHPIGETTHKELATLLDREGIPLSGGAGPLQAFSARFDEGIYEAYRVTKHYEYLARQTSTPEKLLPYGATSWDYLLSTINERALTFTLEVPCARYPAETFPRDSGESLRQLKLRLDADERYLIATLLEEWDKVKADVNVASPFHRKTVHDLLPTKDALSEGVPLFVRSTRDLLFDPAYARNATGLEYVFEHMEHYGFLCHCYEFVRLLRDSAPTAAMRAAIGRLDEVFDRALAHVARNVDVRTLQAIDCDRLARVQLGSGLIALNSLPQ